jgi:hypothetical protein
LGAWMQHPAISGGVSPAASGTYLQCIPNHKPRWQCVHLTNKRQFRNVGDATTEQ